MTKFFMAFILTTAICSITHAQTEYSKYIAGLQEKFGNIRPDQPIVYLDLDIIKMKLAELGEQAGEEEQSQVIIDFVQKSSGLTISQANGETLFIRLISGSVTATPLKSIDKKNVCVIVPSNPNLTKEQTARRLLQWDRLQNTEIYKNKRIGKQLPREVNAMLSDIHETFHCLDKWFIPNSYNGSIDPSMIHKSEAFAEVGALLYLKQLGHENINEIRANTRLVGSYMTATHLPKDPFGEPLPWGAIYSLHRVIRAIDPHTARDISIGWDISDIVTKSQSITNLHAFNSHEFYALSQYHQDKEVLRSNIEKFKKDDYEYLRRRFTIVEKTIQDYEIELEKSLSFLLEESDSSDQTSQPEITTPEQSFDLAENCPELNYSYDPKIMSEQIDRLRQTYYGNNSPNKGTDYLALENIYICHHQANIASPPKVLTNILDIFTATP